MSNSSNISNADIIKYPLITDKATRLLENNQYSFIVDRYSNKALIKDTIEYLFNVKVIKVNTCRLPRKKKACWEVYWLEASTQKSNRKFSRR